MLGNEKPMALRWGGTSDFKAKMPCGDTDVESYQEATAPLKSYTLASLGSRPETSRLKSLLDHLSSHMVAHSA